MSTQTTVTATTGPAQQESLKNKFGWRDPISATVMALLTVALAFVSHGKSHLSFTSGTAAAIIPDATIPAFAFNLVMALIAIAFTGVIWLTARRYRKPSGWYLVGVGAALISAFTVWVVSGGNGVMNVSLLLAGGLTFAVPLTFGALSGTICERTGIINIAIEGQLLIGAFLATIFASYFGSAWLGLIGAPIAGALVGALLALFTINFRTDHIVVGVVINMLVAGVTSFLFSSVMRAYPESTNQRLSLPDLPIPLLSKIPIIGPVLFNHNILVYLMFFAVFALQYMFFHSRWGLRSRACGEHPRAADTVGIKVNRTRWINVIFAGAIAGLGGAFFTVGHNLAFSKEMTAGAGFIALAAMILGRWNPKGAFAAALLFGFFTNIRIIMGSVGAGLPPEFLNMIPYLVTILAVAGFVGAVRPPAAEGKPYP